jgi:hypothetical protein
MKHLIEVKIESLKMELDNNAEKLVEKINKFIKISAFNREKSKIRSFFKINDHRRSKKFKINSKRIGFITLQVNKKIEKEAWQTKSIEELVHKICNNIII